MVYRVKPSLPVPPYWRGFESRLPHLESVPHNAPEEAAGNWTPLHMWETRMNSELAASSRAKRLLQGAGKWEAKL